MGSVFDNFPFSWVTEELRDKDIEKMEEMRQRKIIFLDIDGVLNNEETAYKTGIKIEERKVAILKHIVEETGAEIILSSSWKRGYCFFIMDGMQSKDPAFKLLHDSLEKVGLKISGVTPISGESGPCARPLEIREWLYRFYRIFSYVILDDDIFWDWGFLQRNVVTTTTFCPENSLAHQYVTGLTMEHAERAIAILNEEGAMRRIKTRWAE